MNETHEEVFDLVDDLRHAWPWFAVALFCFIAAAIAFTN
jgi:hypothetical protein